MSEAVSSAASEGANKQATIRYGVYGQPGSHAGKTVGEVRNQLSGAWSIPIDAKAHKGKVSLEDSYVIQPGDSIDFHRSLGEKGNK